MGQSVRCHDGCRNEQCDRSYPPKERASHPSSTTLRPYCLNIAGTCQVSRIRTATDLSAAPLPVGAAMLADRPGVRQCPTSSGLLTKSRGLCHTAVAFATGHSSGVHGHAAANCPGRGRIALAPPPPVGTRRAGFSHRAPRSLAHYACGWMTRGMGSVNHGRCVTHSQEAWPRWLRRCSARFQYQSVR